MYTCVYIMYAAFHYVLFMCVRVVDGGWSEWRLGPCSKTCDGGIQNYTRVCDNPEPSCGGEKCAGPSIYTIQTCNDNNCPGKTIHI